MRIGLIVNPVAGIGGRVGLKGSDSLEIQQKAIAMGAQPQSNARAARALAVLKAASKQFELVTAPGEMGEKVALQCGFAPRVAGPQSAALTSAADTRNAARAMLNIPVDLLLFAGGDGTARDIFNAVGDSIPTLGIPAGVKIYSAVFATHPQAAGEIACELLEGKQVRLREAEVIDLDEEAYRTGVVTTRLYGYIKIPYVPRRVQNKKAPTPLAEAVRAEAIAADIVEGMEQGWLYFIGPGTTTRAIANRLGFPKTLVGVDVYHRDGVVALDANENLLLELLEKQPARIIVTPIGGQGFLFGRGNQQFAPRVIEKVGRDHIMIVSLAEKLHALKGEPFLVDTGDPTVDSLLAGYFPVTVGYHEKIMYQVGS